MNGLSIIVPAQDSAGTILDTFRSIEHARAYLRTHTPADRLPACEVLVVDDGSRDRTPSLVADFARDHPGYTLIRRAAPSNAASARNTGVAASRGDILFFLDADDRFLEHHLWLAVRGLDDPSIDFVKTGVVLDAPVHPDWHRRIINSLVINLAVRRRCHDAIGGFLELHLFRRRGDLFFHHLDVFRAIEDVYYNQALARFFKGLYLPEATAHYTRSPGNAFDRQYEKFRVAPGQYREVVSEEYRFQLKLASLLYQYSMDALARERAGPPEAEAGTA